MKPVIGCNLACKYCYMGCAKTTPITVMSYSILEKVMVDLGALGLPQLEFNWHGGEPLLAGMQFFDTALKFQQKHLPPNCSVRNSLQTNGTLLNMDWVTFLDENSVGVGVSIDGPEDIHNFMRPCRNGLGSFSSVMKGISCLRKSKGNNRHIHALPVISKRSLHHSDRIFSFFLDNNIFNFAFTPCFPKCDGLMENKIIDETHISAHEFATFMIAICSQWFGLDNDRIEIRFLSEIAKMILGGQSTLCIFQKSSCCAKFLTIDALGNVYPCDCYMSGKFVLGNITKTGIAQILASQNHERFSHRVRTLPKPCTRCTVFSICGGGCSYYRYFTNGTFEHTNYYCRGIKRIIDSMQSTLQGGTHNGTENELSEKHSIKDSREYSADG
jgi:uncharacterized protein